MFQLAQLIVEIETKENQQLKKGEATARAKKGTKALAQWATNLSFECCLKQAFPSICKPRSVEKEPMFLRKEEQRVLLSILQTDRQRHEQTGRNTHRQTDKQTDAQTERETEGLRSPPTSARIFFQMYLALNLAPLQTPTRRLPA